MGRKEELMREVQEQILAAVAHPEEIERISKMIADELALGEAFREVCDELSERVQHLELCVPGMHEALRRKRNETCKSGETEQ
jgi:uncharacterized protein YoaH (UPF0181 family)